MDRERATLSLSPSPNIHTCSYIQVRECIFIATAKPNAKAKELKCRILEMSNMSFPVYRGRK